MKRQRKVWIMAAGIAPWLILTATPPAATKTPPKKTELVTYATGPAGETDPDLLGIREIPVEKPDSDGIAALKTTGRFVVDVLTLPLQIVKVLWESATE